MKSVFSIFLLMLSVLMFSSCMTGGNRFSYKATDQLRIGDSEQSVICTLGGRPTGKIENDDGSYDLSWNYIHGPLWRYKGDVVNIHFSKDGQMIKIVKKSSTYHAGF